MITALYKRFTYLYTYLLKIVVDALSCIGQHTTNENEDPTQLILAWLIPTFYFHLIEKMAS